MAKTILEELEALVGKDAADKIKAKSDIATKLVEGERLYRFYTGDEELEEARWLRTYIGKTGFVQLGFGHQGVMMVYEASTEWYDHYQHLLEMSEDFGGIAIDEPGLDDES